MQKYIIPTLAAFILLATGTAFAQTATAGHDVTINIPNVAFLRFTATTTPSDTTALVNPILDIVFSPSAAEVESAATVAPTNVPSWGDLKVYVNRDTNWTVDVEFAPNAGSFDWSKVSMDGTAWDLGADAQVGSGSNAGWSSLGFGGEGFRLALDGLETAGTYSGTVTYTLTAP